jgi:insulysin
MWRIGLTSAITPSDIEAFGREIFSRLYIETLVLGNTTAEGAKEIQEMMEQVLKPRALAPSEKHNNRVLTLAPGEPHSDFTV